MNVDHSINGKRCYMAVAGTLRQCQVIVDEISVYNAGLSGGTLVPGVRHISDYGVPNICSLVIGRTRPLEE